MSTSGSSMVPLTIAGSDPSGGAGLQADLKVFLRFGLSGAAVPTAWTVQGPSGVKAVHALTGRQVKEQLDALIHDVRPVAVKIGMLPSGDVVRVVARALAPIARKGIPIIVDPVFASSDGVRFLPEEDVPVFQRLLVPLATLLTPNLEEAAELAGTNVAAVKKDTEKVIHELRRAGAKNVLIKGGHMAGDESVDILGTPTEFIMLALPRVPRRRNVHGTGCALSAAIAALLAHQASLEDAVQIAKQFVRKAIQRARPVGRGARLLDFTVPIEDDDAAPPPASSARAADS